MPDPLAITAGAWAWDKYGKSLTDKAASALKGRWDKFRWSDAAEKYRAKIKKLYGTMQIMGMAEPVPLDDIFTELYLLDTPTAFSRFDIERLKQVSADPATPPLDSKRITGLSLVRKNKNLFILGKPGAGKTTFLKYIAVQAAEPDKPVIDKVPVFVSLKQWADSGKELLPFIEDRFDTCGFPEAGPFVEQLLKSGGAIVLFDGLDEVNQGGGLRDKQTRAIDGFIEKYDRAQTLITCRIAASDYFFKPFTYVEIADFTEKQIETFVGNWFRDAEGEKDEQSRQRFLSEFRREGNKGLRDLARTPLLLTLLCLAFDATLTFPQRRVEIYEEAVDALLKKWDASKRIKRDEIYRKLSAGQKENMLAHIAAETFERNEYFIPQPNLERYITRYLKNVPPHDSEEAVDGEAILKSIESQHGIFVERAREVYSFSHLTFQEYFTANYIVANAAKGTLANLVRQHCADRRWREVFLLTTSLLSDAGAFMRTLRQGVDRLLDGYEVLKKVLVWADRKSTSPCAEPQLARLSYLIVLFYYEGHSAGRHNASLYALSNAAGQDSMFMSGILISADRDNPHRLYPTYVPAHSYLPDILRSPERAIHSTSELNMHARDLLGLLSRADGATLQDYYRFGAKFRAWAKPLEGTKREWNLMDAPGEGLADYLRATRLLQDCLELAVMPPEEKKAILKSLYLPPAAGGTQVPVG